MKTGRPEKTYIDRVSKLIAFRVKPETWMKIESSTADGERSEFFRGVADRLAAAIESGVTPADILASLDNYQALQRTDDKA